MSIRLPQNAHGFDYEDQVCSLLLAHGYYLETRLILKKGTEEVLEFDAIATPIDDYKNRRIVEVKSGKWGISDLFKLYGQTMYTEEIGGWLIHKSIVSKTKQEAIKEVTSSVPVSTLCINLDDSERSGTIPTALEIPADIAHTVFTTSWWSRSADRVAQSKFRSWCKGHAELPDTIKSSQQYLSALDEYLFKKSPLARVRALYKAYMDAPHITSSLVNYVADKKGEPLRNVRHSVVDNGNRPHLQYVMAQEFRARIAIMKNAYDALLEETDSQQKQGNTFTIQGILKALLPESFRSGMEALERYPYAQQVPYFFQIFIEVFGGFYCPNDERELAQISQATGIPIEAIPPALELLDKFFPIANGWIHHGDRVKLMKGVPAYLRGAGCFAREDLYGKNWDTDFPQISWQIHQWHNALYGLLEPSLKVTEYE